MTEYDDVYFQRRLSIARRSPELSATMAYDLVTSPLSNSDLEDAVAQFNPEPQRQGWGFADVFDELLSREPKRIPVNDIAQLQQNLKDQGYLEPEFEPNGIYDPTTKAAFGQFDRDNREMVQQGNHILAAPLKDGLKLLGMTVPSSIFQGIVGTAKGLAEQTAETFERGGAAGGAAVGAGIGAAIGSVIPGAGTAAGAALGAGIGAVGGFFSSLLGLGDDNDEGDFMDALHPFNRGEWTTPKNLFEDIGYVASAASLASGVGAAGKAALTGASAIRAGGGLRTALTQLDPITQPGYVARLMGSAKGGAALGAVGGAATGLATGENLGDVFQGAAVGAGLGAVAGKTVGPTIKTAAARFGLQRIVTNPVFRTVNKTYTGLATANVGARLTGGLGGGEDQLDDQGNVVKQAEGTTISQNIREAPKLPDWVDLTAGMVLFPERFFPVSLGQMGGTFRKALGNVDAYPYIHTLQRNGMSTGEARTWFSDNIDPITDYYLRRDYGKYRKAYDMVQEQGIKPSDEGFTGALSRARSEIERSGRELGDEERLAADLDLVGYSYLDPSDDTKGPMAFASYLIHNDTIGGGLDKLPRFKELLPVAEDLTMQARRGDLELQVLGPQGVVQKQGRVVRLTTDEFANVSARIADLKDDIKTVKRFRSTDPATRATKATQLKDYEEELASLEKQLDATKQTESVLTNHSIVPARKDYITEADYHTLADDYTSLLEESRRADAALKDAVGGLSGFAVGNAQRGTQAAKAAHNAQQDLENFTRDLYKRVGFDEETLVKAISPVDKEGEILPNLLRKKAEGAGRDVLIDDPAVVREFDDAGYKLIATGEDMAFLSDMQRGAEFHNVGDYTKRAAFWETIGLSPFKHTDESIRPLRRAHEEAEMQSTLEEVGVKMNPRQAMDGIRDWLNEHNNGKGVIVFGPFTVKAGPESLLKRTSLYKIDPRQVPMDGIVEALKLDTLHKVENPLDVAAKVKGALQRGASMGGEVSVKNFGDSVRTLALNMRVNGLQGFSDWMRTFHIDNPARAGAIAGGIAGGAMEAGDDGDLFDIGKGVIAGSLLGAGGASAYSGLKGKGFGFGKSPFKPGHYGYLTDRLHNMNMALRYSLSFTFDAGRYMEQASIAHAKYGLPAVFRHKRYIQRKYADKYGDVDKAWKEATNTLDDAFGNTWGQVTDDVDRRMFQRGLLGFSPREADAAYALLLRDRGFTKGQIKEAIQNISRYGKGRAGMEKTANFVFFPFSFSKKLIGTLGDWMLQEPARAFLIHEGLRRFQETEGDENFANYMERYFPLGEQLLRINNLAYGLSPGRFFLEGLTDNKTLFGKITQGLSSVFVPSGAATPVAQGLGKTADYVQHVLPFFSPVVVTGDDINTLLDTMDDYMPAFRDLRAYFNPTLGREQGAVFQQIPAITEGGAPYHQMNEFRDRQRALKMEFEDLAISLGYANVDSFLQSDIGAPYKAQIDQAEVDLARQYPTGVALASKLETSALIDEVALDDIANDPNRSPGEQMILQLVEMDQQSRLTAQYLGISATEGVQMFAPDIREIAVKWADDRRFSELWERLLEGTYGPIRTVAA